MTLVSSSHVSNTLLVSLLTDTKNGIDQSFHHFTPNDEITDNENWAFVLDLMFCPYKNQIGSLFSFFCLFSVPHAVTNLKGEVSNYNQANVTWSAPRPVTGVLLSYKVSYSTTDGVVSTLTTKQTSIVISDLEYNSVYQIWVMARTSKGYGMTGKTVNITTCK